VDDKSKDYEKVRIMIKVRLIDREKYSNEYGTVGFIFMGSVCLFTGQNLIQRTTS